MKTGMKTIARISLGITGLFGIISTSANAAYFDSAPAPRCDIQLTRQLRFGSEGVDVSVLQDFLNRAGFLNVAPNGHFGPATRTAVRAFQAHNFIPATGQVGPMTLNAINERMCDTDLHADTYLDAYSFGSYGIQTGVTYVDPVDPFVHVVSPQPATPNVYVNPQNTVIVPPVAASITVPAPVSTIPTPVPAVPSGSVAGTSIIYSPSIGYTYGITPTPGMLTILSPQPNTVYKEGDSVTVSWNTNNLNALSYAILLENISTNQSRVMTTTSGNSASFVLTKELLDAVCAGGCSPTNQNSYRIVVTTQIRDIAGNMQTLRAAIQPIAIIRPFSIFGPLSLTVSKTPVSSGELFRLYVSAPFIQSSNTYPYRLTLRAACPAGVTVTIAGTSCGQEFTVPSNYTSFQSEIPAMIANPTWYRQDIPFVLTALNAEGQVVGTATTTVQVHAAPFTW